MFHSVRFWIVVIAGTMHGFAWSPMWGAERGAPDVQIIRHLPRTAREIADAHEKNRAQACEPVPPEEPLELTGFAACLTDRDRREWESGKLLIPSSRRHVLTVGLLMGGEDQARLPTLSSGQILGYLRSHYVTIQARVHKDPLTGEQYLHHRPLAATAVFGRGSLTQEFTDATLAAVREFHSLGLVVPPNEVPRPSSLRTLALTYRSYQLVPAVAAAKPRLQPKYEYVFIRAREAGEGGSARLQLHAFATAEERQVLHRLHPWTLPAAPQQCGVRAQVVFTEFSTLGLVPIKSATRNVTYASRDRFTWQALNDHARRQDWHGDAWDHLAETLDAIIDGEVTAGSGAGFGVPVDAEGLR